MSAKATVKDIERKLKKVTKEIAHLSARERKLKKSLSYRTSDSSIICVMTPDERLDISDNLTKCRHELDKHRRIARELKADLSQLAKNNPVQEDLTAASDKKTTVHKTQRASVVSMGQPPSLATNPTFHRTNIETDSPRAEPVAVEPPKSRRRKVYLDDSSDDEEEDSDEGSAKRA
jgi:hypothetical protein